MAASDDRWAWVEGLRLQTATDVLANEAGKHLADEIRLAADGEAAVSASGTMGG